MKAVFFDSTSRPAARGSFAAETPSQLINCYLVFAFMRGTAKFEGRGNRCASAADDRNFDRFLLGQVKFLVVSIDSWNTEPYETSNKRATTSISIAYLLFDPAEVRAMLNRIACNSMPFCV